MIEIYNNSSSQPVHLGLWEIIIIFICLREEKQNDKGLFYNLVVRKYLTTMPPPPPRRGRKGRN